MKRIKEDKGSIGRYVSNTVFYTAEKFILCRIKKDYANSRRRRIFLTAVFACNANVRPARVCGLSISKKHVKYDKYDVYNLYKNNIDF